MKPAAWLLGWALLLAGCAPATRVVLLPQQGGHTGSVEVSTAASSAVLSKPYDAAAVRAGGVSTGQLDAAEVKRRYAQLLAVQPAAAQRFTLHFETGGAQLTRESMNQLSQVLDEATARPGGEIAVIGHTDRVGKLEANDSLSLQRAEAIRELLIQRGFDAARVIASGHGERDPLVPTADEVAEPRNRRVEIVVY